MVANALPVAPITDRIHRRLSVNMESCQLRFLGLSTNAASEFDGFVVAIELQTVADWICLGHFAELLLRGGLVIEICCCVGGGHPFERLGTEGLF